MVYMYSHTTQPLRVLVVFFIALVHVYLNHSVIRGAYSVSITLKSLEEPIVHLYYSAIGGTCSISIPLSHWENQWYNYTTQPSGSWCIYTAQSLREAVVMFSHAEWKLGLIIKINVEILSIQPHAVFTAHECMKTLFYN